MSKKLILNMLILLAFACKGVVRSKEGKQVVPSEQAPTVLRTSPKDEALSVPRDTNVVLSFSNVMDATSLTMNSEDTTCQGTFQLSSDDFTTCIQMAAELATKKTAISYEFKTKNKLNYNQTYKIKLTQAAKSSKAKTLASEYLQKTGFKTKNLLGGSIQDGSLNLSQKVLNFAGFLGRAGSSDGFGSGGTLELAQTMTSDGSNLYLADKKNHVLYQIEIDTGAIKILAGKVGVSGALDGKGILAEFNAPSGIVYDAVENSLYIADSANHTLRVFSLVSEELTTLTGFAGVAGYQDGFLSQAKFNDPYDLLLDGRKLYLSEPGNRVVRQIDLLRGTVSTLLGSPSRAGSVDGGKLLASFSRPYGLAKFSNELFLTDPLDHVIRVISLQSLKVRTLAGKAGVSGALNDFGGNARFNAPSGIFVHDEDIYVADSQNHLIRSINRISAEVETLAGLALSSGSMDGISTLARFNNPSALLGDSDFLSSLYVLDTYNHMIRKLNLSTLEVTTLLGSKEDYGSNQGAHVGSSFNTPQAITTDGSFLFVADTNNSTIRRINILTQAVETLAGKAGQSASVDATGTEALFMMPSGITSDGENLYVSDFAASTVRKIVMSTKVVTTIAGLAGNSGAVDGVGSAARFNQPSAVLVHGDILYLSDKASHSIRKIVLSSGQVTTLTGLAGSVGSTNASLADSRFNSPQGLYLASADKLYLADSGNHLIRLIDLASGQVTTVVGTAGKTGSTNGPASSSLLHTPTALVGDGSHLYIVDSGNHVIRKLDLSTQVLSTLVGKESVSGAVDGLEDAARFFNPYGITSDGTSLYLTDKGNHSVRIIE